MSGLFHLRPTRAEVDLDSIGHNVNEFRRLLGSDVQIMAVVKAGGYGHGAVEVSRAALQAGVSCLGVALVEEGLELRRAGIEAPIILLGYTGPDAVPLLLRYKLTPTISSVESARLFSGRCVAGGGMLPVHLKIDTGMGRIGVPPAGAADFIAALSEIPGLKLEGLFTHLSSADENSDEANAYTAGQLQLFDGIIAAARERGIAFPLCHAANSAAALRFPQSRYNLIRLGISLYGCYPAPWMKRESTVRLRPAMSLKSKIVFLKEVPPQRMLSYGRTYCTQANSAIATVPIGYADGYNRRLSGCGEVLVRGRRAPLAGRICMDQIMVDVTHIEGAAKGDEVVLYGNQGPGCITVEEVAQLLGTINYELLCNVGGRVPRLYLREGRPAGECPTSGGGAG